MHVVEPRDGGWSWLVFVAEFLYPAHKRCLVWFEMNHHLRARFQLLGAVLSEVDDRFGGPDFDELE